MGPFYFWGPFMLTDTERALVIAEQIKPLLHGRDPAVQGAALAEIVSIYFTGHRPELREEAITLWLKTMRDLVAHNAPRGPWGR